MFFLPGMAHVAMTKPFQTTGWSSGSSTGQEPEDGSSSLPPVANIIHYILKNPHDMRKIKMKTVWGCIVMFILSIASMACMAWIIYGLYLLARGLF